ncbi:hypothetical protein BsWGS_26593 [Bradybaena similaris]
MLNLAVFASVVAIATAQLGLCPGPNGDFPNPNSEQCTTFFRCVQGNPILLRCPANQRFDFLFRLCRQQRVVNCNNQLQVFAAPAAATGLGGLPGGLGALLGGAGGLPGLAGALGGLGGGQLGAGLPDAGLITLLSQLGAGDGDGQNGSSNLGTLLMMTALMNRRNAGNQQQNQAAAGNALDSAVLPIGYAGNPAWPQALAAYTAEGSGVYPGPGITLGDGRPYVLLPQDQNQQGPAYSQRNAYPWNGAQTQSILFGQNGAAAVGGATQPLLQNIVDLPAGKDAGSRAFSGKDSRNETRNASNTTVVTKRRRIRP